MLFWFQAACIPLESNTNPLKPWLHIEVPQAPRMAVCHISGQAVPVQFVSVAPLLGVWQPWDKLGFNLSATALSRMAGCYWSTLRLLFARRNKPTASASLHTTEYLGSLPPHPLHVLLEQGAQNETPFQLWPCLQQAELDLQTTLPNVAQFPISTCSRSECALGLCWPWHPLYAQVLSAGLTTPGSILHLSLLNLPSPCQARGSHLPQQV